MGRIAGVTWSFMLLLTAASTVGAQTDEIQVYTGELAAPGDISLTVHANYTPSGRKTAAFPGGIVADRSTNGAFEWAYGVSSWFEAGTYIPVYTITRNGTALLDGAKLRALFAVPHADARRFFYGINFELSFNSRAWEESRRSGEIRPIIGTRNGAWDFIVNPILDTEFDGLSRLDFAPSARLAYNASPTLALAVEDYADFGEVRHLDAGEKREQSLFGVVDLSRKFLDLEAGVGFGLTPAADKLVLKTILAHTF
ncbi:MAG TPA: hypothetical protein VGG76_05670 [Gemmatimonadaceae bacterium]